MITVTCTAHDGLSLSHQGEPVWLAVVDKHGKVLASGPTVAEAVETAAQGSHLNFLKARGHEPVKAEVCEHTSAAPRQQLAFPTAGTTA